MKRTYNSVKEAVNKIFKAHFHATVRQALLCFLLLIFVNHAQAVDRYWVGKGTATPSWSLSANWSATSGGAGGASAPGSSDNAYFDNNSFTADGQSVILTASANCKNMTWTATDWQPVFDMSTWTISISGSLEFQEQMTLLGAPTGIINFTSATGAVETVITNNLEIPKAVSFASSSGKWHVQDALNIADNTLTLSSGNLELNGTVHCGAFSYSSGSLNLDGAHLTCQTFSSTGNLIKSLSIANATIDAESWFYYGIQSAALTAELTAGSLIRVKKDFTGIPTDHYNVVEA